MVYAREVWISLTATNAITLLRLNRVFAATPSRPAPLPQKRRGENPVQRPESEHRVPDPEPRIPTPDPELTPQRFCG
jgi:hypothetical protein